ncbi:Protein kinase [Elusimicrobium minutum Pei191]|uniref:Protein kinase n=1 Tax=Elusimicrobium minutum (strain Pei191) TaxID=445932 RepID=B2KEB3_ELUMP|nr:serine/threonine-protein kinase [Elusimicrobium minutum]ACC98859.1 Protein kinase [Elusimicrobium minutum Pei191]
MYKRIYLLLLMIFTTTGLVYSQTRPAVDVPLQVGGAFSQSESLGVLPVNKINVDQEMSDLTVLIRNKQYQYAIARVNSLIASGKESPRFNLILAQAYEGLGEWDYCIYRASEFMGAFPSDSRGYTIRAGAYYKKGEYEKASIDIEKSLKINSNSTKAKYIKQLIDTAAANEVSAPPVAVKAEPAKTQQVSAPAQTQTAQRPKVDARTKQKLNNIRWWLIYFILVLSAICIFVYVRYSGPVKKTGARKVDIKEQYHFIRQIGEGGMGKVYEAYDKVLKRRCAVKRVKPELVRSNYVREQFLSEARMVALLRHPNIVEIYTVIESENSLYLVFEYVDGQTLETRLDIDGFIPFSEAKGIFEAVCRGLHYAHAQDIIHCDLKPGNIMITEATAKVMDFGVAKKVVEGDNGARTVAGTPAYMAPEQQKGFMKKQSDIYSLGVCLYEALVGQVPWSVAGFDIANKKIVPPSKLVPFIPEELDALLEAALKEDPNQRIQSIDEFWSALSNIQPMDEKPRSRHI